MSKAINIEFIIILITVQCINLNSYSDNKVQELFPNGDNTSDSVSILDSEKFKQCNLSDFLCRLDHLKQWKRRRRLHTSTPKQQFVNDSLFSRGKRGSLTETRNVVQRLRLRAQMESDVSLISEFKARWPVARWRRYLFTDDYLLLINEHWLRFDPPDPASNYILGALYVVMMCVGGFGNALVLLMYFRCRTLRTPGNILVANLALSDFFMLAKTPVFIFNSFNLGPALGKTGCVIYGFVGGLTGTTSIATLAAIALDRYWAVVRPLEPLRALTAVRARLLAIAAWLYAAVFASVPALDLGYGRYVPEGYLTSCGFDYLTDELPPRYFIFTFFCAAWVAPFATITFCYLNILRVVVCTSNVNARNQERLSSRHVKEQVKRKAEIKLAALVIVVIALFFVSWTPYAVVALMGIFGKKDLITPIVSMIPALFCKTAACINPFIYIITHPKFKKEFRKFIFREKSRRMSTYNRTIGYTEADSTKIRRASKEPNSDTDVEIIQMKDIPYDKEETIKPPSKVRTISSRVSERKGSQTSQRSVSMKSFEESVVSPPSWYAKPQFSKKRSFHRNSSRSIVCMNPDPLVL